MFPFARPTARVPNLLVCELEDAFFDVDFREDAEGMPRGGEAIALIAAGL